MWQEILGWASTAFLCGVYIISLWLHESVKRTLEQLALALTLATLPTAVQVWECVV